MEKLVFNMLNLNFLRFVKGVRKKHQKSIQKADCDHEENSLQLSKYLLRVYLFRRWQRQRSVGLEFYTIYNWASYYIWQAEHLCSLPQIPLK